MLKTAQPYSGPIHSSVEDFVGNLKGITHPVTKGSYLTKHMSDPGFQSVLGKHPQASSIRKSVMNYLNSKPNMSGSVVKAASISIPAFFDELEKIAKLLQPGTSGIMGRLGGSKRARDTLLAMRAVSKMNSMAEKIGPHDIVQAHPMRPPAVVRPAAPMFKGAAADSWHSVADLAGLGVLALPTIQKIRKKKMSEKATHAAELGGLGLLALPTIHKLISKTHGH